MDGRRGRKEVLYRRFTVTPRLMGGLTIHPGMIMDFEGGLMCCLNLVTGMVGGLNLVTENCGRPESHGGIWGCLNMHADAEWWTA